MKRLSVSLVILLHEMVIEKSGGSLGLRDRGLLESALSHAFQTFDGVDLFPDTFEKIIVTSYSLIKNHPFIDGNKRIGILVLALLLKENNFKVLWTDDDLVRLGRAVASGEMDKDAMGSFVTSLLGKQ